MKYVVDTSSLLAIVRYYLPFDRDGGIHGFLVDGFRSGELVLTEAILNECRFIAAGLILECIPELSDPDFLREAKLPIAVDPTVQVSSRKLTHWLNEEFVRQDMKRTLEAEFFEIEKEKFAASADFSMVVLAYTWQIGGESVLVVSEETRHENDSKLYKKVPTLCKLIDVDCINLIDLLARETEVAISIHRTASPGPATA